jgi:rhodanese-related sulfurtransferase
MGTVTATSAVDGLLVEARRGLRRVDPVEAARILREDGLLVDIRPAAQRQRYGEIPGALVIERNVLEWRLDPTSPDRHPDVTDDAERAIVLVCQEGYASSLAAASLQALGLTGATDLKGGFGAWEAAGLPVTRLG